MFFYPLGNRYASFFEHLDHVLDVSLCFQKLLKFLNSHHGEKLVRVLSINPIMNRECVCLPIRNTNQLDCSTFYPQIDFGGWIREYPSVVRLPALGFFQIFFFPRFRYPRILTRFSRRLIFDSRKNFFV